MVCLMINDKMTGASKQKAHSNLLLFRKLLKAKIEKLEKLDKKIDEERRGIANGITLGARRNK